MVGAAELITACSEYLLAFCLLPSAFSAPRLGRSLALPSFHGAMHARGRESQIVCIFSGMSTERRQSDHSAASL